MKTYTPKTLLKDIVNWRSLEADLLNAISKSNTTTLLKILAEKQELCNHKVYVHLSTDYKNDGLGDPDFYSSYRCMICGSTAYDVPAHRCESDTCCINMHLYESTKNYSDTEKFAIAEFRLKQLIKKYPNYTIKQIVNILNEELAEK